MKTVALEVGADTTEVSIKAHDSGMSLYDILLADSEESKLYFIGDRS